MHLQRNLIVMGAVILESFNIIELNIELIIWDVPINFFPQFQVL